MTPSWRNQSPGDLSFEFPEVRPTEVEPAIAAAAAAFEAWSATPLSDRIESLRAAQMKIEVARDELARGIARETGKCVRECAGELGAVIAKFELTFSDAARYLPDECPPGAPHPAVVRRRARGAAAVIGPFNFPVHLAHGQILAYLAAGNSVIFKPAPAAANVCARYAELMSAALPEGVFGLVQGAAAEGAQLCSDRRIRAVGFTGSVAAGRAIAKATADDLSKDVALELGGKCAAIVCDDADLQRAADMCAEAACLTAGQRCNATSRIIVERAVLSPFIDKLLPAIHQFTPGDPLWETTRLGPLVSDAAYERYRRLIDLNEGHWLKRGHAPASVDGKVGYYVEPAVVLFDSAAKASGAALACDELFAPIVAVIAVDSEQELFGLHNGTPFGLTAAVFTRNRARFDRFCSRLDAGNVYANLPTTFSPSQLPFGGWKDSGNGRPGGRGFIRFATEEQAIQWSAEGFTGA
ncbi:MAG TPA: aldehyde dehydrogenase family protein [Tepidisphaeraceae bacterium]|nr:aldehyde dehydrogenase family protein [Tepidisphaeraceae bacterium]